jgi:hypothetical protein
MKTAWLGLFFGVLLLSASALPASAPTSAPAATSTDRLTFLTLQLSSVEESIKAINGALKVTGYKAIVAQDKAADYQKGNEIMDRKGGAPVPWDEFYGKTARSFYLPRSTASVEAAGDGGHVDIQVARGNHPIARPTQFNYLYRANNEQAAKALQEVAAMDQKSDVLLARRRQLENEQSAIWATIAFESIGNREIAYQPLYRFALRSDRSVTTQPASDSQRVFLEAVIQFLRAVDHSVSTSDDKLQDHQEVALNDLKQGIESSDTTLKSSAFDDLLAIQAGADDLQQARDLIDAAKRLRELSRNIADAYHLAADGDAAGDEERKQTFRAQLQESLLDFADATDNLDDAISALAAHWVIRPQAGVLAPQAAALPPDNVATTAVAVMAVPPVTARASAAAPASAGAGSIFDDVPSSSPKAGDAPDGSAGTTTIKDAPASTAPPLPNDGNIAELPAKRLFTSTDKITGNLSFTESDGPYTIQGKLSPAPGVKNYAIDIGPHTRISGGILDFANSGHIRIMGTPASPAIFTGVTFNQSLGGFFQAEDAIFDDCKFHKSGAWFSRGGNSSKWVLDKCLIRGSNSFARFTQVDYGIKFTDCTFDGVIFQDVGRPGGGPDKPANYMKILRKGWRTIDHCRFENCTVSPTIFWCAVASDYIHCNFIRGAAFESDTPTEISAFVSDTHGDAPDKINAANPPKRATLNIAYAVQPFEVFSFPGSK